MEIVWNPWHGCKKYSEGCLNCFVYRIDKKIGKDPSICERTKQFDLPVQKLKNNEYKIKSGSIIYTCLSSDFFLDEADKFRIDVWKYIKERRDCNFKIITKRIDRFLDCIPDDWNDGYDNVEIICTIENQKQADYRLPIFIKLPIKCKSLCLEPLLEEIDISHYIEKLNLNSITVGGESGPEARICDFKWVREIYKISVKYNVPFWFKQTGTNFIDDERRINIVNRKDQMTFADEFGLNTNKSISKFDYLK